MEDCPCCHGRGEAHVSMVGFDVTWLARCEDCDGTGRVWAWQAVRLRAKMRERVAKGYPRCFPGGVSRWQVE